MSRSVVVRRGICWSLLFLVLSVAGVTAQSLLREYWLNIAGGTIADLTNAVTYPYQPNGRSIVGIFEGPSNWADNYGSRLRGYVKPPQTGNYTFWIAGDDNCELWLSTDEDPGNRRLIARVATWTGVRVWEEPRDGNNLVQKSALIPLEGGKRYYVEALQKDGGGGDNLAAGWQLPDATFERPIPGTRLAPFILSTNAPTINVQPADVTAFDGDSVRFTVAAVGMDPLSYQWQRDGVVLPDQQSSTLLLSAVHLMDSGAKFSCVITNAKGNATTRDALLTVSNETTPPTILSATPPNGATVRGLTQLEILFSEPVDGVDASDVLFNGAAATAVSGAAAGPYIFTAPTLAPGVVTVAFASAHGITDISPNANPFAGASWTVTVDPNLPAPKVRISEINASNENGLVDEDGEAVDWIEVENFGTSAVSLNGWSLSDSKGDPGQWIFPDVTIAGGARLIVFASGKDRRSTAPGHKLHTSFLLAGSGEFLGLFDASSPRQMISGIDPFPEQRTDISYGLDSNGAWKYFSKPTPGLANGVSDVVGIMPPPHFSSERGFYSSGLQVYLTTTVPGAEIHYTKNGGDPSGAAGVLYTGPIGITATTVLRASVVKANYLPSAPMTHTYLVNISSTLRTMPALSIVTATNNLIGPTGIIGISGGTYGSDGTWQALTPSDYDNASKGGIAWERPTSAEFFYPTNTDQFQIDCGIRVQGSEYTSPRYTPSSKFSYRLYFRGDYGIGKLEYPLFNTVVNSFDQLVLRAGHNDMTNPFIRDELARRLFSDCGQVSAHGNFESLFVNGVYKGYYNLTERIEKHMLQAYYVSSADWDVVEPPRTALDGDTSAYSAMVSYITSASMTNSANYLKASGLLDLTNFVDYLLVNIYGATIDWPGNNWRVSHERTANGICRYHVWDAEISFGGGNAVDSDSFAQQLAEGSDIPTMYRSLRASPEFRLLWADRVQKHFYNGGALTDTNITRNYTTLRDAVSTVISGFDTSIGATWIPQRRRTVTNLFTKYGLAGAPGAPSFSQFGGRVPAGYQLKLSTTATGTNVAIYYTIDGSDPRVKFTGAISTNAQQYTAPITLNETTLVRARMLTNNATWSAITEATFEVSAFGAPVRFTEINYNPPGGDAYEFIELKNFSGAPVDLSGMTLEGVTYRFPERTIVAPGSIVLIASDYAPALFAQRYHNVIVTGYFTKSSLSNGGERLALRDRAGNIVTSVDFHDDRGWPTEADGGGYSLELVDRDGDPNNATSWRRSENIYGTPGTFAQSAQPTLQLSEVMPMSGSTSGWIEIFNNGAEDVNLANYSLGDAANARRVVLPEGITISAGGYFVQNGFPIGLNGGTVFLYDANTNRVDGVSFWRMVSGDTLANIDGVWTLGTPTPGTANIPADLAPASNLIINEWMANSLAGSDDWIELYNRASAPVALQGITLSVTNSLCRIPTLGFIPANGFAQLFASEKVGPDQLSFKLPATGGTITLYDPQGVVVNSVSYGVQLDGVSEGRLPDGGTAISKFRGSASPGASNYVISGTSPLVINEVMARNRRAVISPAGETADWIELFNSGAAMSLDGYSLSGDVALPGQWNFPTGITLASGDYLVVWFDKANPPSTNVVALNTGRALSAEGGGVYLFNSSGQTIDQIEYGMQATDLSIGRGTNGWALLKQPTPGSPNSISAALAGSVAARINEWAAASENSPAWVELFNTNAAPIALANMSFTDELTLATVKKFIFPPLSFLAGKDFGRWITADSKSVVAGEINFNISELGEALRLYSATATTVDTVAFGALPPTGTLGRVADGIGSVTHVASTPGLPNYIELPGIIMNEVAPVEGMIEIRNLTTNTIDISGWKLTDNPLIPVKWNVPDGSILAPLGYVTLNLGAGNLDAVFGGTLTLSRILGDGTLTSEEARLTYGAAVAGQTYGYVRTFTGSESHLLVESTLGAANTAVAIGPIVISEIMYHPADDSIDGEYLELHNGSSAAVNVNRWRINGGVQFNFTNDFTMQANATILLVHFDPSDTTARSAFISRYQLAPTAQLVGPLRGKLGNDGDLIRLERPLPAAVSGYIPFVAVDEVNYASVLPWPIAANGGGSSLHRVSPDDLGNEPVNWVASNPSPLVFQTFDKPDRDGDGIPDVWEIAHGLNIYDPSDAGADPDGDGLTNLVEYRAGSDPFDASSGFAIHLVSTAGNANFEFVMQANQVYRVEYRDNLTDGAWQLHSTHGPSTGSATISIPLAAPGESQRFYRLAK